MSTLTYFPVISESYMMKTKWSVIKFPRRLSNWSAQVFLILLHTQIHLWILLKRSKTSKKLVISSVVSSVFNYFSCKDSLPYACLYILLAVHSHLTYRWTLIGFIVQLDGIFWNQLNYISRYLFFSNIFL